MRRLDLRPKPRHLYDPLADEPELSDEDRVDGEPLTQHYEAARRRIQQHLERTDLDEETRTKLTGHLQIFRLLWERETIEDHWTSGEGDRKLF
ncbi:hypothetical protein Back2_18170 [Nocardioides baekrokdamisoli]|uniref:Uncharacterized protein n=1 Tax=Nocardioides baekrokdamisoli TaxID=1804624 RepID=A0A3G9IEV9_9ACTN|nr:hypothetical protein [Nocardioides baekrokdamisoli]BBH17530.1 hypothetical protein Back2_18170 [Nocardioides baekrokdamisoli]